jgi:hypothetical protein
MADARHRQNTTAGDYVAGVPGQFAYAAVLGRPLLAVGLIRLWKARELRFLGVAVTIVVVYVLAWVPGKIYYADGMLPLMLGAGAAPAEGWLASAPHRMRRRRLLTAGTVTSAQVAVPAVLPVVPLAAVRDSPASTTVTDSIGLAATDSHRRGLGQGTDQRKRAAQLGLYGRVRRGRSARHLRRSRPPAAVIPAHNSFWTSGRGASSDRTVLVVGARSPSCARTSPAAGC